ncbi:unnamed protein product [Linum trigynum]|uniref:Uncharacterized protein n=1 Tax=Linum trigynum TaxID=586398 RepID=A0AAV2GLN9_9ROSI
MEGGPTKADGGKIASAPCTFLFAGLGNFACLGKVVRLLFLTKREKVDVDDFWGRVGGGRRDMMVIATLLPFLIGAMVVHTTPMTGVP